MTKTQEIMCLRLELEDKKNEISSLQKTILLNGEKLRVQQERIDELQARICAGDHHLVMVRDTPSGMEYVCTECGWRKTVHR